eukprot:Nitzschia sp. Nitz4//scaffold189_size62959//23388//27915//NITZ4_006307-RA/size62959-snap-gene-0.8-mRNA-1//-1//CDS//3329539893//4906//frame0
MAALLLEEPEGGDRLFNERSSNSLMTPVAPRRRGRDDDMDSDQEDYMILGDGNASASSLNYGDNGATPRPFATNLSFPRLGRDVSQSSRTRGTPMKETQPILGADTSYASALKEGQSFFQRARIVSVSTRHGFPPSKDPTGEDNRIRDYFLGKTFHTAKLHTAIKRRPIDGILPSGWLEKHAAALPSVIMVVVQVNSHQQQHEQDKYLHDTMENLRMSLAPKRNCTIRVVGIIQEGISTIMSEQWLQRVDDQLQGQVPITLVNVSDLQQGAGPSRSMQGISKIVRDESLNYYQSQVRQTKRKLLELGQARNTPLLLPLAIRYSFKIAVFYEFQWNPEKSLKYMAEAYKLLETYYRYLMEQREIGDSPSNQTAPPDVESRTVRVSQQTASVSADEGVELSIPTQEEDAGMLLLNPVAIPEDMVHQCRVLADWLNFKILQSALSCHNREGFLAASSQWQKHTIGFCNPRTSFICSPETSFVDWAFVAHQRLVASQLLERHPPRALGDLSGPLDEDIVRCSSWRAFQSTAEATLRLAKEVEMTSPVQNYAAGLVDDMRSRYVGGLDKDGFQPKLQEVLAVNHVEKALNYIERAIALFEKENTPSQSGENDITIARDRAGARLYFLAGKTLSSLGRYEESFSRLKRALSSVEGWQPLEGIIRGEIVKCYEGATAAGNPISVDESVLTLVETFLSSSMPEHSLRGALEALYTSVGGTIKWEKTFSDESTAMLPFAFDMTFPTSTQAISGETVSITLQIKSNLVHSMYINNVTLRTLAGDFTVPPVDGNILIKGQSEVTISTVLHLPKNLEKISLDPVASLVAAQHASPKAVLEKEARPWSSGLTSGGGARMVSEDQQGGTSSSLEGPKWSEKYLGGKPLKCEGLLLSLSPVGMEKQPVLELALSKTYAQMEVSVQKKTPVEEDSYISSTWLRSGNVSLSLGPRSLRVVRPASDLVITNVSELCTNGKALEGTVNRVVLRLMSGQNEECKDIAIRVAATSFLVSTSGVKRKIMSSPIETDDPETVDGRNEHVRMPILVQQDMGTGRQISPYGYVVPEGWSLTGGDGSGCSDGLVPVSSSLKAGGVTYTALDVFRPSPLVTRIEGVVQVEDDMADVELEHAMCTTEIDVVVQYRQYQGLQGDPSNQSDDDFESVTQSKKFIITWCAPITAEFSSGLKETHPSGNRHPSNAIPGSTNAQTAPFSEKEMVLVDGERLTTKCSLEAVASADGLVANLEEIHFESSDSQCNFELLSGVGGGGLLHKFADDDVCRRLVQGSKYSVAWTTQVLLNSDYMKGGVSASLGVLVVAWTPTSIDLPDGIEHRGPFKSISVHGPLKLHSASKCRLMGPPCYIENAPFETLVESLPTSIKVATPFKLSYNIRNKTSLDQSLKVSLGVPTSQSEGSQGLVIAGPLQQEVDLGPFESYTLSYTTLPTRPGLVDVPPVDASSTRYKTWVIREGKNGKRKIFVDP